MTLDELREEITVRVIDAGGPKLYAERVGLTASAWSNIMNSDTRKPGPAMLKILGYVEDPPQYRAISNHFKVISNRKK